MTKWLSGIFALGLLSSLAWAQIADHESSLVIELDKASGMWTMVCDIEVDGIVPFDDHRVSASVQYQVSGTTAITIARSDFDILGNERSKSELTYGQFAFEAKKMGDRLTVGVDLSWPAAGAANGEAFICVINVTKLEGGIPVRGGIARMQVAQTVYSY